MSAQATMHRRPRPAANAATPEAGTATPVVEAPVSIGTAAARAGVSQRMVRHYEALGLLRGVARTDGGYRQYGEGDIHTLRFIRRARDLGFSMEEIATLLGLWQDQRRASREVKRIAQAHIDDLGRRIESMQAMQRSLQQLVGCCQGDGRPDCPILDDLAGASEE
ncbi:Cu(I)-responsive transcriptional regulator [Paracidovorax avenae]|uniref:Cu(I)-responsive transcriptional regulator n=1 Tax=Paracidovorax avenae TaxID=80867 RepID=UPI0022778E5E|nr:Cu(I)-responsive transcriptional regulator [Paracidovorax avenae]